MSQAKLQGILRGIISGACRQMGVNKNAFLPPKPGGEMLTSPFGIEWYVPIQNIPDVTINSSRAQQHKLIRRIFRIYQAVPDQPVFLEIREWNAEKDWGKPYRPIWTVEYSMFQSAVMMSKFVESYGELVLKKSP